MTQLLHYIDGAATAGSGDRTSPVYNPADGSVRGSVRLADGSDIDAAVSAAKRATHSWGQSSIAKRTEIMFRFREIFAARRDEIAQLITSEHGKVLSDALGETARALENIEFACGIGEHLKGQFSLQVSNGIDVYTLRQPVGVVAGITPFNFPVMVPAWMFANAIACGNTFVLKPSERTPSAAILVARWLEEAGLPTGVFNVVHGGPDAVEHLICHPDVGAVSFVGSTDVARRIYELGTAAGKRVQALGGAKNHMVVLPDADLDAAADAVVSAAYGAAGERCMAISALVAVGDIADDLVDRVNTRLAAIVVGPGTEPGIDMGPLITLEHRNRVAGHIERAAEAGASIVADGRESDAPRDGFFLGPTLLDNVSTSMECYSTEIFGPVLCVLRVPTLSDAIETINANPYGNGAAIFTSDGGAGRAFQLGVHAGMIGVNVPLPVPVSYHSFGGWKASLFGDTHVYGPDGVKFYTRAKAVTTKWPEPATSCVDFSFPTNA
jgi:malonate-semialdehyde dehydrogenase (acetylating)/methylmalonate-semialdehyde dehydrogenase